MVYSNVRTVQFDAFIYQMVVVCKCSINVALYIYINSCTYVYSLFETDNVLYEKCTKSTLILQSGYSINSIFMKYGHTVNVQVYRALQYRIWFDPPRFVGLPVFLYFRWGSVVQSLPGRIKCNFPNRHLGRRKTKKKDSLQIFF